METEEKPFQAVKESPESLIGRSMSGMSEEH